MQQNCKKYFPYATFQDQSGDRIELMIDNYEYNMLVEDNHEQLPFQGIKYLSLQRD